MGDVVTLKTIRTKVILPLLPEDQELFLAALSERTSKDIAAKTARREGRIHAAEVLEWQCAQVQKRISKILSRRPKA